METEFRESPLGVINTAPSLTVTPPSRQNSLSSPVDVFPPPEPSTSLPSTSHMKSAASSSSSATTRTRTRSSSSPIHNHFQHAPVSQAPSFNRAYSTNMVTKMPSLSDISTMTTSNVVGGGAGGADGKKGKGRARSASLITVKEVGVAEQDSSEMADLGAGGPLNWEWVDSKGAWLIHPILILLGKFLIDAIPGMNHDLSWTLVNCGYMIVTYLIFHQMVGIPFENTVPTGGAYDDLTLWEQIDNGAQYTPAKKWLTSVPIGLFLISTHYTRYNPTLFFVNFLALVVIIVPKLPQLHRLRFYFFEGVMDTPGASHPPSPIGTPRAGSPIPAAKRAE